MKIEDLRLTDEEAFKVSRPVEGYPGLITECDRVRMDAATLKAARMALSECRDMYTSAAMPKLFEMWLNCKLAELEDEG